MINSSVVRTKKGLGQVLLINPSVAQAEAAHAVDKVVLEIGPGPGMLTQFLCKNAKKVIAVEKDDFMCMLLKQNVSSKRLKLINKDFLEVSDEEIELPKIDIVIANVPYNISSRIIGWLGEKRMHAVLCLQKEFVEHMLAAPDTHNYSRLSVMSSLLFRVTKIMNVSKGSFRPIPKVDSAVIYMKPKDVKIDKNVINLIGLIMQHKKKTVSNAIMDSRSYIGKEKDELSQISKKVPYSSDRVFKLPPEKILEVAKALDEFLK